MSRCGSALANAQDISFRTCVAEPAAPSSNQVRGAQQFLIIMRIAHSTLPSCFACSRAARTCSGPVRSRKCAALIWDAAGQQSVPCGERRAEPRGGWWPERGSGVRGAGAPQGPPLPPEGSLFGAAENKEGFHAAIHVLVHRLGRHLGFQAFNCVPGTEVRLTAPFWPGIWPGI